jgi:predicted RNA-binding Zn ribbon-like protein
MEGGPVVDIPVQSEPLAVELVDTTFVVGGTRGHVVDVLTTPAELLRWLRSRTEDVGGDVVAGVALAGAGEEDVRRFQALRRALRELMTAETGGQAWPREAVSVVNRALRAAVRCTELSADGPGGAVEAWSTGDWTAAALARVAASGVAVLSGEQRGALRACHAPGCILFFVRDHPRREWCSAQCGNRARVARHSRRHRPEAPGD